MSTPETAAGRICQSAKALTSGDSSVADLRSTLLSNLNDLCRDHPLEGDYFNLFQALERWEASVGTNRTTPENNVKMLAERLAAN